MKTILSRLPFYVRFHLVLGTLGLFFLTIYRVAFFSMYSYRMTDKSFWIVMKAFLKGVRFDISVLSILLGFSLVYSSLHFLNRSKIYRAVWRTLPIVFVILLLFLLIADLIYYENGNKHLGYEAFAYLGLEMFPLIGSAFAQNPLFFLFGLLVIALISFGIYKFQRRFPYTHTSLHYGWASFQFLLILALVILGIRGGIQTSPLRNSDAIITKETITNDLVLNPGFTVITDLKMTKVDKRHVMALNVASKLVQEKVSYSGAEFVSSEYPLLRRTTVQSSKPLPNIIVIVLEGWTGKFIDIIGDGKVEGKEVTPHFNKLIRQGMFFQNFFASGGRTTNGLMALMGGIPDRPGLTAVRTPQILNRFSGLGNIAKTIGYDTLFVTGTDLSFNNKGSIMYHWGFDTLVGKQELEKNPEYKTGPWSYLDESSLDAMHKRLLEVKKDKPIVSVIHTGTTHYPYKVPEEKFRLFGSDTQDSEYLNVLYYADFALKEYLDKAKTAPYFKDSIFFFVSDHSHHRFLNYYEDRNVPFLIYAPGRIKPEIRKDITSQLDLIPTILGFLEREVYFSVIGRDLRQVKGDSAYFAYGNIFGWIEDDFLYYQSVQGGVGETKTIKPPFIDIGLCYQNIKLCEKHSNFTKAYLNLGDELLKSNKLFPSETVLSEIKSSTKN
ncbi:LTA synthase family protein [Leptospira sp. 96542]|nr:LTA synthase family protein [Leptospira sp. 96542]